MKFSSNLSAVYTKWCGQTFPPIFGLFAIFDCNFVKIVAQPSDKKKWELCSASERGIPSEKCWKFLSKSAYKGQRNARSNYAPSNAQCSGLGAWQNKQTKKKQKHHHEGNAVPAGYYHPHMLLYVSGVNYSVNSNYTKYLEQLFDRIFTFWKISTANLLMLWCHLPTELRIV